jgi:hypothetical protein
MLLNSAAIPLPGGFAGLEIPLPDAAADPTKPFISNDILCQMADLWEPKRTLSLS